jgi:hypothetical protein
MKNSAAGVETASERERVLRRFGMLMEELAAGSTSRTSFYRWEIDLIVDLEACRQAHVFSRRRLRAYQRAVEKQVWKTGAPPACLSEFIARWKNRGRRNKTLPC